MNIAALFSLMSIWLALCGSVFFAIGVLKLKPEVIARLSQAYFGLHFDQVSNLVSQKADFICGIIFIIIASLFQTASQVLDLNPLEKYALCLFGIGFIVVIHLLPFLFLLLRDRLTWIFKKQTVSSYCRANVVTYMYGLTKKKKTIKGIWSEEGALIFDAKEYCRFEMPNNVTFDNFFKKYAKHIKAKVPSEFDWSALPKIPINQIK